MDISHDPDKEEEKEACEVNFVIANFKAGECFAVMYDSKSYMGGQRLWSASL